MVRAAATDAGVSENFVHLSPAPELQWNGREYVTERVPKGTQRLRQSGFSLACAVYAKRGDGTEERMRNIWRTIQLLPAQMWPRLRWQLRRQRFRAFAATTARRSACVAGHKRRSGEGSSGIYCGPQLGLVSLVSMRRESEEERQRTETSRKWRRASFSPSTAHVRGLIQTRPVPELGLSDRN